MGILISVYKSASIGDCTNGGITSRANQLVIVNCDGPFEPSDIAPAAILQRRSDSIRIVPAIRDKEDRWIADPRWVMFGGNYGATSDSRFADKCRELTNDNFYGAVAIHDRYETDEQSRLMD